MKERNSVKNIKENGGNRGPDIRRKIFRTIIIGYECGSADEANAREMLGFGA
jgi:hypothetical protein